MIPQPEISGGLLGQLRVYARQGSDENAWAEGAVCQSSVSRAVMPKGEAGDLLRVDFEAKRSARSIGQVALRTFFTLRASYVQSGLSFDFLPQNAVDVLRRQKVNAGESEQETVTLTWESNEDEAVDDEFAGYDEMSFRHQRSVEYVLDGRGKLLHCNRDDFYEDEEGEAVDIVHVSASESDSPLKNESDILTFQAHAEESSQGLPLELLRHPDLKTVEEEVSVQLLAQDMMFLDIVQTYASDRRLSRDTRIEHRREMLTLLAFLRMEASVKDVRNIV